MAEVFSPQVVTREVDISTVAPAVSTSIAAIVGGATKGPVNDPTFISTQDQFVEIFGQPVPNSMLGYAALNFLRQGNQLWVNRVASLSGDDPVSDTWDIGGVQVKLGFATTDTRASIETPTITNFNTTGSINFLIDGENVTVSLSPVTSATIDTMVTALNNAFGASTPKLARAYVSGVSNDKITVETISKAGPYSTINVLTAPSNPEWVGLSGSGERTVMTAEALTPATITSGNANSTINTTVTYDNTAYPTDTVGTLYNVSKLSQESYGSIDVIAQTFTAGQYNSIALTMTSVPADTDTLTLKRADNATTITFEFDNNSSVVETPTLRKVDITGLTTAAQAAAVLATAINNSVAMGTSTVDGTVYPTKGVRAVAVGNVVTLTQIHPDAGVSYAVTVGGTGANYGTITGTTPGLFPATSSDTDGGTTGSYVAIHTPTAWTGVGESNATYFFKAGIDFSFAALTITEIATSLANAINTKAPYDSTLDYILGASASSNQVIIESTQDGGESGGYTGVAGGIGVALDWAGASITANDLFPFAAYEVASFTDGGTLQHGFDARPAYVFGIFSVDGTSYAINMDAIPLAVLPDKHEATIAQIVAAVNYSVSDTVASSLVSGGNERLVITSPTAGSEGSTSGIASTGIASPIAPNTVYNDPMSGAPTNTPGSGDNHFTFKVDDTYTVDVYLTQDSALTVTQAVAEINGAATAVDSSLSSVASVSGNQIVLTSPTSGTFADFGSRLEITNDLVTVTPETVFSIGVTEGTGSKVASTTIRATSAGTWANDALTVAFTDEDSAFYAPNSSRVDVLYNGIIVETYREVVCNPDADGSTGPSGQGTFIETAINDVSDFITVDFDDSLLDLDPDTLATSVKFVQNTSTLGSNPPYELSGGNDGINGLTSGDVIGVARDTTTGLPTGMQVFANTETIFINLIAAPGFTAQAVGNALVTLAETRQDTLAFIDPPMGLNAQEMVDWHNGQGNGRTAALNSSYAATYNSWLEQYDPYNDINIYVPPSVFVLAQMAYNDSVADPWFATAGLTRGRLLNALDVLSPTELGDRELLYGQGNRVNPIPKFRQEGIVLWGNRTTYRQESALKEITVRRLLNYAKVAIGLAAKVILFEPNDPDTSKRLINIINPVLYGIRVRRGLTDFKVVDATTDRDRNLNRLVIKIFLQPTRTVEVIEIPFIITAQGGSFAI